MMTTNQKKVAGIGHAWPALGWDYLPGNGWPWKSPCGAAGECEWSCFHAPGTPWNSRWVARAARSPRSSADSTRDDLHAATQYLCTRLALMTRGLLTQTSQSSILGRSRHCANRRSLPDWHNSTISGLCAWRRVAEKGELAVLTKNDDLHVVRTGETVEDHVVVKAITQESVTLQDRQSRVRAYGAAFRRSSGTALAGC